MNVENFVLFFEMVADAGKGRWSTNGVDSLAAFTVPGRVYGPREALLKADMAIANAKWFLDGLVDPAPFASDESRYTFAHLAERLHRTVMSMLSDIPRDEAEVVWRALSRLAWEDIQGRRLSERVRWSRALRVDLWDSISDPYCYLCGFKFSKEAGERFLAGGGRIEVPLPRLTDFVRPRTKTRHVCIEIDHVLPLAEGGPNDVSNLRLACGWCNIAKGRRVSIYDTQSWSEACFRHPSLGWVTIPRPLWTLRIVGLRGRCEHRDCTAQLSDGELRVAPLWPEGALTPPNMKVFCYRHDPWRANRFIDGGLLAVT